jgi:hypothetical protein
VALVRTDVSEERITSIITVTGIGELGTTLAGTSNITANVVPSSPILVTLKMEVTCFPRQFLQGPHGVTSQETAFFLVIAVKALHLPTFIYDKVSVLRIFYNILELITFLFERTFCSTVTNIR